MSESDGFSAAERAAMKQRAEELRATKGVKGTAKKIKELEACLETIDGLEGLDRVIGERLHVIVSEVAPDLDAKTRYGFPTYVRDGEVIVFFQPASKFNTRYAQVAFEQSAQLDDGAMWPTAFAIVEWNDTVDATLRELVTKAVG